jgi:hypothetical protein
VNHLADQRARGQTHSKEDTLTGPQLRDIKYLRLYSQGHSIRVYFTVHNGDLWMLLIDANKRATDLSEGTAKRLRDRLREIKA